MGILSKSEKKLLVIKLYENGLRNIWHLRIYPRDIGKYNCDYTGEKSTICTKSDTSKTYAMFLKGKPPIEITIRLYLKYEEDMGAFNEYMNLQSVRYFEIIIAISKITFFICWEL